MMAGGAGEANLDLQAYVDRMRVVYLDMVLLNNAPHPKSVCVAEGQKCV